MGVFDDVLQIYSEWIVDTLAVSNNWGQNPRVSFEGQSMM